MRHQTDHVATLVADPCDVVDRSVRIVNVPEHHPVFALQPRKGLLITGIVTFESG
jgi:uncharacterized protein (UPF0179 family)